MKVGKSHDTAVQRSDEFGWIWRVPIKCGGEMHNVNAITNGKRSLEFYESDIPAKPIKELNTPKCMETG